MKYNKPLFLGTIFVLLISSCNKETPITSPDGTLSFSLNHPLLANGRAAGSSDPAFVLFSLEQGEKNILESEKVAIFGFGESYISDPISLPNGNYTLTSYHILNENSKVIYATPKEGSDLAHLVNDPMPINFNLENDITLSPEVISTESKTADDFGYLSFAMNVIETISIPIAIFEPINNQPVPTTATLRVTDDSEGEYVYDLSEEINNVVLPAGATEYTFELTKEGYQSQLITYSEAELSMGKSFVLEPLLTSFIIPIEDMEVDSVIIHLMTQELVIEELMVLEEGKATFSIDLPSGNWEANFKVYLNSKVYEEAEQFIDSQTKETTFQFNKTSHSQYHLNGFETDEFVAWEGFNRLIHSDKEYTVLIAHDLCGNDYPDVTFNYKEKVTQFYVDICVSHEEEVVKCTTTDWVYPNNNQGEFAFSFEADLCDSSFDFFDVSVYAYDGETAALFYSAHEL